MMIEFNNVTKRYPTGQIALKNVNFSIQKGDMVFVTGHSGAGKSSLLKLIAFIEKATSGRIVVKAQDYRYVPFKQIPFIRRNMGIVFQDPMLVADKTIYDNVALPLVVSNYRVKDINKRVSAALELVGLRSKLHLLPEHLSCGEQQRVGIARAIVHKPPVLLADEPTGNLDPDLSREIIRLFEQFNRVGATVIIATHDVSLINEFKKRILTLQHGGLISDVPQTA